MTDGHVEAHPVQLTVHRQIKPMAPATVTRAAYEVYCELYGPQPAIVTGWCRGGFSAGELIAYLYARAFPRAEWRQRVAEANKGMQGL